MLWVVSLYIYWTLIRGKHRGVCKVLSENPLLLNILYHKEGVHFAYTFFESSPPASPPHHPFVHPGEAWGRYLETPVAEWDACSPQRPLACLGSVIRMFEEEKKNFQKPFHGSRGLRRTRDPLEWWIRAIRRIFCRCFIMYSVVICHVGWIIYSKQVLKGKKSAGISLNRNPVHGLFVTAVLWVLETSLACTVCSPRLLEPPSLSCRRKEGIMCIPGQLGGWKICTSFRHKRMREKKNRCIKLDFCLRLAVKG